MSWLPGRVEEMDGLVDRDTLASRGVTYRYYTLTELCEAKEQKHFLGLYARRRGQKAYEVIDRGAGGRAHRPEPDGARDARMGARQAAPGNGGDPVSNRSRKRPASRAKPAGAGVKTASVPTAYPGGERSRSRSPLGGANGNQYYLWWGIAGG